MLSLPQKFQIVQDLLKDAQIGTIADVMKLYFPQEEIQEARKRETPQDTERAEH